MRNAGVEVKMLGVLAIVAALALSACDGDDGTTQGRGPTDSMVPDDGPQPIDQDPTGGPTPETCMSTVPIHAVGGLSVSSTRGGVSYLCYACSSTLTWEAPTTGCLLNAGASKPILCVPLDYGPAGCK